VNGSSSLNIDYADGYLVVHFRRTRHAAGQPGSYVQNVRPGTAAWVDRPLNDQEPGAGYFEVSRSEAAYAQVLIDRG
jgi:hypothetical protein